MSSLYSALFGNGGAETQKQALDEIRNVPLPVLKKLNPELYEQVVTLNPSLVQNVTEGPSAMDGIALDPAYKQAQMQALAKLQNISENGGQDLQYQADMNNMLTDVGTQLKGQEDAITQNLATRGLSGGMTELVSRDLAAQNSANRAANAGLNIQAQAQQRALQALMNQNQVGAGLSQQEFSQKAAVANADDAISRFNASNLQSTNNANAAAINHASEWNAGNQQNISNKNADVTNKANEWNQNGMAQQNYNNAIGRATGAASQLGQIAAGQNQDRSSDAKLWGGIISSAAGAYGSAASSKKATDDEEKES